MATNSGGESAHQLDLVRQICRTGRTPFAVLGPDLRFSGATEVFVAEVGGAVEGRDLLEVFGPAGVEVRAEIDRRADDPGHWSFERRITTPTGVERRLQCSHSLLDDEDGFYAMSIRLLPVDPPVVRTGSGDGRLVPDLVPGRLFATVWLDESLVVVASDGLSDLLGAGQLGVPWIDLVHPDDVADERPRCSGRTRADGWAGVVRLVGPEGVLWVQHQAVSAPRSAPAGARWQLHLARADHWVATRDALLDAEATLTALTDELSVALVEMAPDGRITYGNPALADLLGCEPVGRWVAEVIAPAHLARVFAVVAAAFGADEPFVIEFPVGRPDGTFRWVRATGRARRGSDGEMGSLTGTWVDITSEFAERSSSARFAEILDSVDDLIAITDGAGSIVHLNERGRQVLGPGDGPRGTHPVTRLLAVMPPEQTGAFLTQVAAVIAAQGSWTGELDLVTPEGPRTFSVHIASHVSDLDGRHSVAIVARDVTAQKVAEALLRERASRDALTGLANRSVFLEELGGELRRRRGQPSAAPLAVLFIDLDRFKPVNDDHGHGVGDRVLAVVGARLGRRVRGADLVARFGGDEFVVLCRDVIGASDATRLAERLVEDLTEPVALDDEVTVVVGASVGVALARPDDEADQLIARADLALRQAKDDGRGRVAVAVD